jgi:hypothetical protein
MYNYRIIYEIATRQFAGAYARSQKDDGYRRNNNSQ